MSEPADLLAALADDVRLRVFAAVVLGSSTTGDIAEAAGLRDRDVLQSLVTLEEAGLVQRKDQGWVASSTAMRAAVIARSAPRTYVDHGTTDSGVAAVLRVFMPQGRLERIPASRGKRLVVLDQIARVFEPGVRYPEQDVNALLSAFHPDYAALRRHLVDEAFLARERNIYWRIGGTVELDIVEG